VPAAPEPASREAPPPLWRRPRWRLGLLGALLLLALVAVPLSRARREAVEPVAAEAPFRVRSIAVLPFLPLAGDDEDAEMLGLAMADALITRLSEMEPLVVRPTSAVQELRGRRRNTPFIGAQLGVDAVMDGSLQRDGDRLRVSLQLLRVPGGEPLWAGTFDTVDSDPFAVQDAVSRQVAEGLSLHLSTRRSRQLGTRGTSDPVAYQEYVRGRYFWNRRTEADLRKASEHFRAALDRDPAFAAAHAGLADCWVLLPLYGNMAPGEAFPLAIAAAGKALELDPELVEAHTTLAYARFLFDWDWRAAEEGFQRAHRLDPDYPTAPHWHSYLLSALGRHDEAVAQARLAQELDPLSLPINADHGLVLYFARRYDEAIAQFGRTLELDPRFAYARFGLALAYAAEARHDEAVSEAEQAVELSAGGSVNRAALGYALGLAGRDEEARRVLGDLTERARAGRVQAGAFALVYAGLGEPDAAFEWLDRAHEERSRFVVFLQVWPVFDGLREDPRFAGLIRRVGLPAGRPRATDGG
jgi:TolB-like protein/tetratricopeptide (TPR) repeat protein